MRIIVEKEKIVQELQAVLGIVERKSVIPIASYILIDAREGKLKISASDLENSFSTSTEASIEGKGKFVVQGHKIYDIARLLKGDKIEIESENGKVIVKSGTTIYSLITVNSEDFPNLPVVSGDFVFDLEVDKFSSLVRKVIFPISSASSIYKIRGAFFNCGNNSIEVVSTDGSRMSVVKVNTGVRKKGSFILSKKSVTEASKLVSGNGSDNKIKCYISSNHVFFVSGERVLSSTPIESRFPDYKGILSSVPSFRVEMDASMLKEAIQRVSIVVDDKIKPVKFTFFRDFVELEAFSPSVGKSVEKIECLYSGEEKLNLTFEADYLLQFLGSISSETIEMRIKDKDTPSFFSPIGEDLEYTHIMMPLEE